VLGQEQSCHVRIADSRCRSDATLFEQVAPVFGQQVADRRSRDGGGHRGRPESAQVSEQRRHTLGREPEHIALGSPCCQERLDTVGREIANIKVLTRQPTADVGQKPDLIGHCVRAITPRFKVRTEPVGVRDEWPGDPDSR
jgi:hypothetical protein